MGKELIDLGFVVGLYYLESPPDRKGRKWGTTIQNLNDMKAEIAKALSEKNKNAKQNRFLVSIQQSVYSAALMGDRSIRVPYDELYKDPCVQDVLNEDGYAHEINGVMGAGHHLPTKTIKIEW